MKSLDAAWHPVGIDQLVVCFVVYMYCIMINIQSCVVVHHFCNADEHMILSI